jgi:leucyl aminopeptidase
MSLEFALNASAPAAAAVDCVMVGAFADGSLTPAARALDAASGGRIAALAKSGDVSGKTGKTALLHDLAGVAAPRVLVIGLGDAAKFGVPQYIKAVGDAARALRTGVVKSALFTLAEVAVKDRDAAWNVRQAAIAADHACYRYLATLGEKNKKRDEKGLERFEIPGSDKAALAQGVANAAGVQFTRELGNLPPNVCNPAYIAQQAQEFAAKSDKVECEVLDDAMMESLGMGSLLAVARGSAQRPRLVVL